MKVVYSLGAGGSFTEFYAMDFDENVILMGHDGQGPIAISDRKPVLRSLGVYHEKASHGVSVEFGVRTGPGIIFGVTQTRDGRLKMLAAESCSLPGPTLRIGNINSRLWFGLPPSEFTDAWCEEGPTHHCALGTGHHAGTLRRSRACWAWSSSPSEKSNEASGRTDPPLSEHHSPMHKLIDTQEVRQKWS